MTTAAQDDGAELRFDLLGIGNAIVDVLSAVSPAFVAGEGLVPGSMSLIDAARADALYAKLAADAETSGGSVANSCVYAARLGARVAYLGKVAEDALGAAFRRDIVEAGVHFPSAPLPAAAAAGRSTARCLVLVTPDGQRTMSTYLGACTAFAEADVLPEIVSAARVTYLEGYLFDPPAAQRAFLHAAALAHAAGRQVALSLSDPFCVDRHRAGFRALIDEHVDILFANEAEVMSLYETGSFEAAAARAAEDAAIAVLTRSERGSVILAGGERIEVAAVPTTVVDTTGAGDAYAAGFLAAWARGEPLARCGRLGSLAASEVISHWGARPVADLSELAAF